MINSLNSFFSPPAAATAVDDDVDDERRERENAERETRSSTSNIVVLFPFLSFLPNMLVLKRERRWQRLKDNYYTLHRVCARITHNVPRRIVKQKEKRSERKALDSMQKHNALVFLVVRRSFLFLSPFFSRLAVMPMCVSSSRVRTFVLLMIRRLFEKTGY